VLSLPITRCLYPRKFLGSWSTQTIQKSRRSLISRYFPCPSIGNLTSLTPSIASQPRIGISRLVGTGGSQHPPSSLASHHVITLSHHFITLRCCTCKRDQKQIIFFANTFCLLFPLASFSHLTRGSASTLLSYLFRPTDFTPVLCRCWTRFANSIIQGHSLFIATCRAPNTIPALFPLSPFFDPIHFIDVNSLLQFGLKICPTSATTSDLRATPYKHQISRSRTSNNLELVNIQTFVESENPPAENAESCVSAF
jgi:hypothetical protein